MRKLIVISSLMMAASTASAAQGVKYVCTMQGAGDRIIEVVYQSPDATLPCDVAYTKNGTTKNLWHYDNTLGACEARAAEFADKERGYGFDCTSNESATTDQATDDNASAESSSDTAPAAPRDLQVTQ